MKTKMNKDVVVLCEGAVMIALAIVLSFIELELGVWGGSIGFAMIPIAIFALRRGAVWGIGVGFVFGTLKFFIGDGTVANWVSLLLDYSVAYGTVGLAGLFCKMENKNVAAIAGTAVGCLSRYLVSFISGVTVYAEYAEPTFAGISTPNAFIYSIVYNGAYMIPSTIIALVVVPVIFLALKRFKV